MANCPINSIDSNVSSLSIAEEECIGQLPTTPVWWILDPDSYDNFGMDVGTVVRDPLSQDRQDRKGSVTGITANAGFLQDLLTDIDIYPRLLQGVMFSDANEKPSTLEYASIEANFVSSTTSTDVVIDAPGASDGIAVLVNHLVVLKDFAIGTNNKMDRVSAVSGYTVPQSLTIASGLTAEASPPAAASVTVCGFQFGSGTAGIVVTGGTMTFTSSVTDLTTLGLTVGEWLFIGGDDVAAQFNSGYGYGRISDIQATQLTIQNPQWSVTPATDTGSGKLIHIYFGKYIPNGAKKRFYSVERTLGEDADGVQAEYIDGAVANEFNLTMDDQSKVTTQLSYVGINASFRTGAEGLKTGDRPTTTFEGEAFNTSTDVFVSQLFKHDDSLVVAPNMFSFVKSMTIKINNGTAPNTAIGAIGAIGVATGNFKVSGTLDAYFETIAAQKSILANDDVGFYTIFARQNLGLVVDVPLVTLGGGQNQLTKNKAIMSNLTFTGAKNKLGYTMGLTFFPYLPTVAMPLQ